MKKKSGLFILAIIFVIFSVVSFAIPFAHGGAFWIAYVFGVIAIAFQLVVLTRILRENNLNSRFLGFPVLYIGAVYLIVQLITSIIVMTVPGAPIWIAIVLFVIFLAVACIASISGGVAKTAIENTEAKVQPKISYLKDIKADVEVLISQEKDPDIQKELKALANIIRYSDPMSDARLQNLEKNIAEKIAGIDSATDKKKLIAEIKELMNQRNTRCKQYK